MTLSAIPNWLDATRETLREALAALPEDESLLLGETMEALRDAPYRVPRLGSDRTALALTGIFAARLHVMHEELDPLVTSETAVARARALGAWLVAREEELRDRLPSDGLAALRYDTLATLNPPPWENGEGVQSSPLRPDRVRALVTRWEAQRAAEPLRTVLRKKLSQHADFYRHFASMPAYWFRRRHIRRALSPALRENPVVMETYFAIEQVGPIIDGFVFRARGRKLASAAGLADFAFLYMQMADELVDNLVHHLGPDGVRALVEDRYPRPLRAAQLIPFENLDDEALERAGLDPATPIEKYRTDFSGMLALLREIRAAMVTWIEDVEARGVPRVGAEVQSFFHHCFATYLDELHLPRVVGDRTLDQLPLASLQWHFFRKNNIVMMRFMALRARLTGLDPARHHEVLQRWGYLLATFQVFDDMKDVWVDLGFQPNYALQTAAEFFPDEYQWLARHIPTPPRGVTRDEVAWLNTRIPNTVLHCIRLSRLMALSCFDYLAMYAWDHRWRKNWMGRFAAFNPDGDAPLATAARDEDRALFSTGTAVVDALLVVAYRFAGSLSASTPAERAEQSAFALDAVAYEHPGAVYLAALPNLRRFYRYATLRMMLPASEKTALLRRLVARHAAAVERGRSQLLARGADTALLDALLRSPTLPSSVDGVDGEESPGATGA